MTSYKELYYHLFGAMTDAIEELEQGEIILAIQHLIAAQREAEERVLEADIVPEVQKNRPGDAAQAGPGQSGAFGP